MNSDKGRSRRKMGRKRFLLAMITVMLLGASATGTSLAYLAAGTNEITNQFEGAAVKGAVEESFNNFIKKDVTVKNTGDTDAYVRVALIPNWVDSKGEIYRETPKAEDYKLVISEGNGWSLGSDGFYYYTQKVDPGAHTTVLVELCEPSAEKKDENGNQLQFQLHVAASLIQARPDQAVIEAWGQEAYSLVTKADPAPNSID
ncbi:MAG: hypothetical protein HFG49_07120 [Lachnospiraceae bacterium]|jgi:hypothetical protein|nr:hypothetical protein [Lachnospiraceae bacterium]